MKKTMLLVALSCTIITQAQDTFTELPDHKAPVAEAWEGIKGIQAAWGTSDVRYAWHSLPDTKALKRTETLTAWRGERVSTQAVIYSAKATDSLTIHLTPFKNGRFTLPSEAVKSSFVRYVKTDAWSRPDGRGAGCGYRTDHTLYDSAMVADIIDPHATALPLGAMSTRSVWVSCQIPSNAVPGTYSGTLCIKEGKRTVAKLPIHIKVIDRTLPHPEDWKFHLDLWQNPFAEARYYNTPLWSDAHLAAMAGAECRMGREAQAEFGEKIGVKASTITGYELGTREPSDAIIMAIEREFPVNPRWLEDGVGEMIIEMSRDEEISSFMADVQMGDDSFKRKIVSGLTALDADDWANLKVIIEKMAKKQKNTTKHH